MGLSDIDEDEPVTHSPSRPIVLAPPHSSSAAGAANMLPVGSPLGVGGGRATAPSSSQYQPPNHNTYGGGFSPTASASGGSVLDDLFGAVDIDASGVSGRSAPANASPTSLSSSTAGKASPTTYANRAPANTATAAAPSVLDDLFAAPTPPPKGAATGAGGAATSTGVSGTGDNHAMLYVDGSGAGATDDGTNLFDLSKPVKKDRYNNAESFLDAFERQGKRGAARVDQSETLANLTRNKDDNKVRARLLALMNYYDVLGVAQTAGEEEIKRSYKKKALELHPDRVGRDQTQEEAELFKVITKAHEVLTDPEQRRQYDASLRSGAQPAAAASPNDWWSHVNM